MVKITRREQQISYAKYQNHPVVGWVANGMGTGKKGGSC